MKKKSEEIDVMGSSQLPDDVFTPTTGFSYLVGEDPDLQYGMGVLERVLDPELHKSPALPTGLQRESSQMMDLQEYLLTPEITDLSWLDPSEIQDPARLPKDPHDTILPELEVLWGPSNPKTIRANTGDLSKILYEQSLEQREVKLPSFSERTYEKVVTAAMRRSAMGQDVETVIRETLESVGESYEQYITAMDAIKSEHGLVGTVYIRASAFPNYSSGKWNEHIRKYHSNARYIVVAKEDLNKTFIEDGRCVYSGKKAVLEVPWEEAFNYYAPRLKAAGYRVAGSDKKTSLRRAFLRGPEEVQHESNLPVQENPADKVSSDQAVSAVLQHKEERKVLDPSSRRASAEREKALRKLSSLRGVIPDNEISAIINSNAAPRDMVRSAAMLLSRVKEGSYSGREGGEESLVILKALASERERRILAGSQERADKHLNSKMVSHITRLVEEAYISRTAADKILSSNVSPEEKIQIASKLASTSRKGKFEGDNQYAKARVLHNIQRMARTEEEKRVSDLELQQREAQNKESQDMDSYSARKTEKVLASLVSKGLIHQNSADLIKNSNITERSKVRMAAELATMSRKGTFQSDNQYQYAHSMLVLKQAELSNARIEATQKAVDKKVQEREFRASFEGRAHAEIESLSAKVAHEINRGIKGRTLREYIRRTVPQEKISSVIKVLTPLLKKTRALENQVSRTANYEGTVFTQEKAQTKERSVLASNIKKASTWLKRTLSEGFAGSKLDELIQNKFSDKLLQASSTEFSAIREQHEGASGFIYVDASAYASQTGSTGCEKAASKHRANGIPAVAAMDRCETCAHNKKLADGTPRCSVFNKTLLFDAEIPEEVRQNNIRSTDMTDAEVTASYFSSTGGQTYNPEEFGLVNANLEGFGFEDTMDTEKLSKILFNGWDIE